ncbi:MAG: DUF4168 domain-containing protein [Gemmatimonadetes bacterium]|nr:DUF4168 domain-containing protein [Gemmatimonadota bacterium]MCC6771081.1 DUF4168 domain-containing protein [Gemmatimonadaceae bacterium]
MLHLITAGCATLLTLALSAATPTGRVAAQQTTRQVSQPVALPGTQSPDSVITQAVIDSFARTHAAVAALRDRYQALLAEPQNKTNEEQDKLHEKLVDERLAVLKAHGFTPAEFARLIRRVSADTAARRAFDAALARLPKQAPPAGERVPPAD